MSPNSIEITKRNQEQVILRAKLDDSKTKSALKTLGLKPPTPRMSEIANETSIYWFSPDEALLFVKNTNEAVASMSAKLPKKHLIHDATGARIVFTLKGMHIIDALSKGTPRDLSNLKIGEVVRTHLGQFAVAFWFLDHETVEIVGFRSFGDDIEAWLKMACDPSGLPVMNNSSAGE